jgi:acyl carrier protein
MVPSESTLSVLTDLLLQEVPALRREQITPTAELFKDLGLDSIAIVNVMVAFEERVGRAVDLLPWFTEAKGAGSYTVQSVVDFVDAALREGSGDRSGHA